MKKLFAVCFIVLVMGGVLLWIKRSKSDASFNSASIVTNLIAPNTAATAFKEMTIPYLREREYHSTLGGQQKLTDNSAYTSYLTSYDSDGLKINALLTVPKGTPPEGEWPAIVFVHGYIAPTIYKTTDRYVEYVNYLAKNGFVVFKIDLRGHGSSEGTPSGAYYSSDYVIDTLNAYAALESLSVVNPKKIGLWGHSMAGNVTARAFAARPTIPAVVIWAGAGYTYTDLLTYRLNDRSYRPPQTNSEVTRKHDDLMKTYGAFSTDSSFWKEVAITDYLPDLKGALEVHHAVDDTVVSIEYSRNLMKLLDKTNVEHTLYEYPSGGHNISGSSFTTAMQRTVAFYKSHLSP